MSRVKNQRENIYIFCFINIVCVYIFIDLIFLDSSQIGWLGSGGSGVLASTDLHNT